MRILITGSHGMVGRQLIETFSGSKEDELMAVAHQHGDLSDLTTAREIFSDTRPDVVINAAAFANVDDCEDPKIYPKAYQANTLIPKNLAALCNDFDSLLVHISTDYVYDGKKPGPYLETDAPAPLSAYGRSKLGGDEAIIESGCKALIIRTAWLFGRHGKNFMHTILNKVKSGEPLRVVNDQRGAPTSTEDLAKGIKIAVEQELTGLYHLTCMGQTTWYDFAVAILKLNGARQAIQPITSKSLRQAASRPSNSVLDSTRFMQDTGFTPRSWKQALEETMKLKQGGLIW